MMRKKIGICLLLLFLLSACSGREKYQPFVPLSEVTVSPERQAAIQSALNGNPGALPTATPAPAVRPTDELADMPSFDEDTFFTEVGTSSNAGAIPTEESPFDDFDDQTSSSGGGDASGSAPAAEITLYGTQNGLTTYTLQEGEDLICIGKRFDISISQLLSQNNLEDPYSAKAGDVIFLPKTPNPWSLLDGYGRRILKVHPTVYTVQSGDTLFSIACAFGDVRPEWIATKNQMNLGDPLTAGTRLAIP